MNSLKFKFFIIFIILGFIISVIGYVPYMDYITRSYTTELHNILTEVKMQNPVLSNIGHIVALGEKVREYCDPGTTEGDLLMPFFNNQDDLLAPYHNIDLDRLEEALTEKGSPLGETFAAIKERARARYNYALEGEFGAEVRDKILEFEALNEGLLNLRSAFNLEFISYMQVLPGDQYRYVLSSDFSYFWLENWGLNDLLYPIYNGPVLGSTITKAVATKQFQISSNKVDLASWGTPLVPAFLPIEDGQGNVVGVLEADYRLSSVYGFRLWAILALAGSILLSALAAFLVSNYVSITLVRPIKELKRVADALAKKDFNTGILKFRKDELGEMQKSMIITRDNLRRALSELREEKNEITAMKDNLRAGIFLMNQQMVIQGQYSIAMETVFGMKELYGKNFLELLSASFRENDLTTIHDFFEMVLSGALKQKKIDNMNPLAELNFIHPETKDEKTLRCNFVRIQRENGEPFVLGTIEDVTAETKLRKRLEQEEKQRQEEMRSLFEIVHVDSMMFSSFLVDFEYNFENILLLLKQESNDPKNILVSIYQLVHATKSDAAIIGLGSFAEKLHEVEDTIKRLMVEDKITFSSMLRFTVDIERIMQTKEKMQETLTNIHSQKTEVHENHEEYMLVESLRLAAVHVADDNNKKVAFVDAGIDSEAFKKIPRRELKDILIQLVRNGVYHGIELPEERQAAGKKPEGTITLEGVIEKGEFHVILADDGRGLDYNKIREKALEKGIMTKEEAADNKKVLEAIFEPAFSTANSEDIHAGRGIGLNLVRDRVKQLNGSIRVNTKLGKGTIFHIFIPVS